MNRSRSTRIALCLTFVLGGVHLFAAAQTCPDVDNLLLASGEAYVDQDLVAFTVGEFFQGGTDLNGDGDSSDAVFHVYDRRDGSVYNLRVAVDASSIVVDGRRAVMLVVESDQGNQDLNGDGDAFDQVYYLYDADAAVLTNLGLAGFAAELSGDVVALNVSEGQQGIADLNGDGDANDQVLYIHEVGTGVTTNTGLAFGLAFVGADFVGCDVDEGDQGFTDLNGDGDTQDSVVHVFSMRTMTSTNLGLAGSSPLSQSSRKLFAFPVSEFSQGGTDLNGDGDAADHAVLHVYDPATATTINLGLDISSNRVATKDRLLAFRVFESSQGGTDLNGDGDASDNVVHLFDSNTGITTNIGLAAEFDLRLTDSLLAFRVSESGQGGTDLNGDGDLWDLGVAHAYLFGPGLTVNLGHEGLLLTAEGTKVALVVRESGQNATDFNGDGDAFDNVAHVFDVSRSTTTNLGLDGNLLEFKDGFLAFNVSELRQGGTDLNGDGDSSDNIVHVFDAASGVTIGFGLPTNLPLLGSGVVTFTVSERSNGFADLNGDTDTNDNVLHVVSLRSLDWQFNGPAVGGGSPVNFTATSDPWQAGNQAFLLISLGDGLTAGGIKIPGSDGQRLFLDLDPLLLLWATTPLSLRMVTLSGCAGAGTLAFPLPPSLVPGHTIYYAGFARSSGGGVPSVSPTRFFVTQ